MLIYDVESPEHIAVDGHVRDRIALVVMFSHLLLFASIGAFVVITTFVG